MPGSLEAMADRGYDRATNLTIVRHDMAGLLVFKSLADAVRAGFHVYDKTAQGYIVRTRTQAGWELAVVEHQ